MSKKHAKKNYIIKQKSMALGNKLFMFALALGFFVGMLFFARPSVSETEKRTLTEFPALTVEGFLDGSWFSDISLYYSDTYPFRDTLISFDQFLKRTFFGIQDGEQMIGSGDNADDIPDEAAEEATEEITPVSEPDSYQLEAEIKNQIQSGLCVQNGTAYSIYYFDQVAAKTYTSGINSIAAALDGKTQVYSILVPDNSAIMLSEDTTKKIGGSNTKQAIDYYNSLLSSKVKKVPVYDILREHNSEYLYFRTDHHWTATGAYYAYRNMATLMGDTPFELSSYQTKYFEGFLGSYYNELKNSDMKNNPDTVVAYVPHDTNDLTYIDGNGNPVAWNVVRDVSTFNSGVKYSTFAAGDQKLVTIENPKKTDGSTLVVLKESYGNAIVPFLVDHFQTIYVLDFRYSGVNVKDFCIEKGATDLLIINDMSIISSPSISSTIAGELQ